MGVTNLENEGNYKGKTKGINVINYNYGNLLTIMGIYEFQDKIIPMIRL